jgi:coenzyme F420-reducing hydrogenase delta subunit
MADIIGIHGAEPSDDAPSRPARVVPLGCVTYLDLPPDRILDAAKEHGMDGVIVIGFDLDGNQYFASSYADGGTALWLLEKCKAALLEQGSRQ